MSSTLTLCDSETGIGLATRLARNGNISKIHHSLDHNYLSQSRNPSVIGKLAMLDQYDLIINQTSTYQDVPHGMCNSPFCQLIEKNTQYFFQVLDLLKLPNCFEIITDYESLITTCKRGELLRLEPLQGTERVGYSFETLTKQNEPLTSLAASQSVLPALVFPSSIDCYVTGWFNGKSFSFFTLSLSQNRDYDGERGPQCLPHRARGRVTIRLTDCDMIRPFEALNGLLQKVGYWGPLTFCYVASEKCFNVTRIVPRFFIYEIFELTKLNEFDLLWNLHQGNTIELSDQYAISIALCCYSYPGVSVFSLPDGAERHAFVDNVSTPGKLATSDLWLGQVTARAATVHEARRRVYRTIKNSVLSPDVFYRTDIGYDVEFKLSKLAEWGMINALA